MENFNHFFASANSADGFLNNFKYINNENKKGYQYILKGGPGKGKSTLLKTIAKHFENLGETIEYFHCSSDPKSLDGVRLKNRNISLVDGTAPHITECQIPSIKDEIINLGEYIENSIKKQEEKIRYFLHKKSDSYMLANNYLSSLKPIFDSKIFIDKNSTKENKNSILLKTLNLKRKEFEFFERKLFINYFSSDGIKELENSGFKTINLECNFYQDNLNILELKNKLYNLKISYVLCPNLINPEYYDAIIIPSLKVIIKSSSPYQSRDKNINFLLTSSIKFAGEKIEEAITFHKEVEKFYINSMNFSKINKLTKLLIKKIEKQF